MTACERTLRVASSRRSSEPQASAGACSQQPAAKSRTAAQRAGHERTIATAVSLADDPGSLDLPIAADLPHNRSGRSRRVKLSVSSRPRPSRRSPPEPLSRDSRPCCGRPRPGRRRRCRSSGWGRLSFRSPWCRSAWSVMTCPSVSSPQREPAAAGSPPLARVGRRGYTRRLGRGVVQPGSTLASGARGRRFESSRPDHFLICDRSARRSAARKCAARPGRA